MEAVGNDVMLEQLRSVEVDRVRSYLSPSMRVLEIGGGSGYQAKLIASLGCEVTSVDLDSAERRGRFYPVATYDGVHLPFADSSFDVVFSSNVLEHVKDLDALFEEMKRVLKPKGRMIHILPSPAWRVWSLITHPIWIVKSVLFRRKPSGSLAAPELRSVVARRGWPYLIQRAVVAPPHGEFPSAFAEIYFFSAAHWRRVFHAAGMKVAGAFTNRLFYSGYTIAPRLGIRWRERLSGILGSACNCFVLERSDDEEPVR